ncbi:MAG: hypothetical protein JNN07_26965, partial [Verrucomicrobiales bacterium]|nr:hypothetical protein [Verrucomicrobiales bacterium]
RAAELAADDHRIAEAQIQHVWHQGTLDALEVPLAISPHVDVARRRLKERKLRAAKLLHEAAGANSSQLTPSVVAAVESAIQLISAPHPGGLLDKIEISLSRSGPRDPAGFLAWWNEERRQQTVGPIASKGTLDGPIGEAKAPPPRPLTRPKPLVLVAPLAGIPAGSAEATQARFEEALRLPGNVELRSITPQIAGRPLDTATAEGLLREHQATTLVLGSFGETVEGNEKATAGRRVSSQRYWEVPLTVTVVSLEEGRIASRRKAFTGEARRPSGSSDGGGASEAIADAIVRLSDDGGKFLNLK